MTRLPTFRPRIPAGPGFIFMAGVVIGCVLLLAACRPVHQEGVMGAMGAMDATGRTLPEELRFYRDLTDKALSYNNDSLLSHLEGALPRSHSTDYRVLAFRQFLRGFRQLKLQQADSAGLCFARMFTGQKVDTAKDIDLLMLRESALAKLKLQEGANPGVLGKVLHLLELNRRFPSRFVWWPSYLAAELYFGNSDWDRAEGFLLQALRAIPDTTDYSLRGQLIANFSRIETARRHFDKALAYEDSAGRLALRAGDLKMTALSTAKKGLLYFELGDTTTGTALQMKALRLSRQLDKMMVPEHFYSLYVNLGWTFLQQHRYHLGLQYGRQALNFSGENHNAKAAAHEVIYEAFIGLQEYDSAIAHLKETFNAILRSERILKQKEMASLDLNYELRREKAHSAVLSERNATKNALLAALLVILILVVLLGYNGFRRRKLREALEQTELKERLLRSQMDPHFIFNILTALQSLARNGETEKLLAYQERFSRLLRISLENSRHAFVALHKEVEALEHYLSIQQMRFGYRFEYRVDYYEGYEEDDMLLVPPMLLQPFAENAILHGLQNMEGHGEITISLEKGNGVLCCTIEDNGGGLYNPEDQEGKVSHSTDITRERLKVLSKKMGKPAGLQIINKADHGLGSGVLVELLLPYRFAGKEV